jgi:hypothetical protein
VEEARKMRKREVRIVNGGSGSKSKIAECGGSDCDSESIACLPLQLVLVWDVAWWG